MELPTRLGTRITTNGATGVWSGTKRLRRYSFESDCNSNQIPDSCEIADGLLDECDTDGVPDVCTILDSPSQDSNNDGILDRCQCITDINGDGFTDFSDVLQLLSCWGSDPTGACGFADVSDDGIIDFSDVLLMLNDFGPC